MINFANNRYKSKIRLTVKDKEFLRKNKGKKQSMANYLEEIIKQHKLWIAKNTPNNS